MVMLNNNLPIKWLQKYSKKPIAQLTPGTISYYKWAQKIGRKEYLKLSRQKTNRFERKHKGNLQFRVFKSVILKNKNVSLELMVKFKNLIEQKKSAKGSEIYKHLTPKALYNKMKEI